MSTQSNSKKYVKMDPIEHVLLRSDMYVGSNKPQRTTEYVCIKDGDIYKVLRKEISVSPAILRIFIEILSNATDNVERSKTSGIPCSYIKININKETGETSVVNDGDIIPIEINSEENVYNHSLIFGNLLTGSNYDDEQERLISGRNGIGSKATNIFSSKFTVKGVDPNNKLTFEQTWTNNMKNTTKPIVGKTKLSRGHTSISYFPDFKQFDITGYNDDIISIYLKYIIDVAMLSKVKVYFNDELIPVNNLQTYSKLYECSTDESLFLKHGNSEVLVTPSKEFQVISFVNGIYTKLGGQHVDSWLEAIFRPLVDKFNKKGQPTLNIKDIKQFFRIFVVSYVVNPEFESQNKNRLENPKVPAVVKSSEIAKILKWSVIEEIEDIIKSKEILTLKKSEKKKKGYVKVDGLDPANKAGTKDSHLCSLILCEGLSAKTYAVAGIEKGINGICGRDYYGVLALKGKLLNVRNSSMDSIAKNKVITDLIQSLNLQHGVDYMNDDNFKNLSYGKVILLTDADSDGLHISGLIMNFFHSLFPSLLKRKTPFLISMQTPIVRVFRKEGDLLFYDENKFKEFSRNQTSKIKCKYYKGLGTTKSEDVKDTFGEKMIEYMNDDETDVSINKVFHVKYSDQRKDWLEKYDPKTPFALDDEGKLVSINMSDFLNNEVIKFSHDDCKRSIPHLFDGLKESQRKVLYSVKKRNLTYNKTSLKVAQLAGYVAEVSNYHHGEQNLFQTITKMANEFPGSNNIPLLYRDGQFGCLDPNTLVLLWNGSKKKAKDVLVGDLLIGDDGEPRKVLKLVEGEDEMYEIKQQNGLQNYIVNSQHILTLFISSHKSIYWSEKLNSWVVQHYDKNSNTLKKTHFKVCDTKDVDQNTLDAYSTKEDAYNGVLNFAKSLEDNVFDIRLEDYLKMSNHTKRKCKGIINNVPIKWNHQDVPIDPYIFGHWLGDENQNSSGFSSTDEEFEELLKKNNLFENKHIPESYIKNDVSTRLKLLAGFIDSVGSVLKTTNSYVVRISHSYLMESLQYIANSLGFGTSLTCSEKQTIKGKMYTTLYISGENLFNIPTKIYRNKIPYYVGSNNTIYSISVNKLGKGKFNGWSVDKNERFLLGDFTVTHNSRINGGIDAANARYIFTKMEPLTPLIFREEDDILLERVCDDGDEVEPKFYIPIIPMVLVNGAHGIGSGWSSSIPCYNPLDIIQCIEIWLKKDGKIMTEDEDSIISYLPDLVPWYRGFNGTIEKKKDNDSTFVTYGIIEKDKNKSIISELPIGMWTDKFKEMTEDWLVDKKVKNVQNYSTPNHVYFVITESDDGFSCNLKNMKLHSYLYTSNMVLFNEKEQLKKYTIEEIINDFCVMRFEFYKKRKAYMISLLEKDLRHLFNKARFVEEVIEKKLIIMNIDEEIIVKNLEKNGFDKENVKEDDENSGGYNYLLKMQVRTFTSNKVKQLRSEIEEKNNKLNIMKSTSEKQLWLNDLEEFKIEYNKWLKVMEVAPLKMKQKPARKKKET